MGTPKPNKGRDANHDIRAILNDVRGNHDVDRNKAGQILDAIKAGSVSITGTY